MSDSAMDRWDKAGWFFLIVFVIADFASISVSQIAAGGLGICWAGRWIQTRRAPDFSPIKWPVAAFIVASLMAALMSLNVKESIVDSKDLTHFFIFFAAYDLFRRHPLKAATAFRWAVFGGSVAAVVGLAQIFRRGIDINNRISGFNDIYMTFAGLLMMASMLALAIALFDYKKGRDGWIIPALGLMIAAALASLTRNTVIGVMAGTAVILAMRKPVTLLILPVAAVLIFAVSPAGVKQRVESITDVNNVTNRERIYLWQAGLRIIKDHPLFGVGQNSFPLVYPEYRHPDVKEPNISHLHNNFIELAAERGLVGLSTWIFFWGAALWVMGRAWRKTREPAYLAPMAGAIGATAAFLAAGIFEYNFGASVMQMILYFILAGGVASAANIEKI